MLRWLLLLTACAAKLDPLPPQDWVAPLVFREGIPTVHVVVGGQPAWMIVDSGASYHFIADTLARDAELVTVEGGEGHDVVGHRQEVRISSSTRIEVGSWNLVSDGVLVTDLSRTGVQGLLSPQWIPTRGGTVAVDFVARELRWMPAGEASRRYAGWLAADPLKTCLPEMYATLVGVHATLAGTAADLAIDTGSTSSVLESTRAPGQRLSTSAGRAFLLQGVGGTHEVNQLPDQPAVMGRVTKSIRAALFHRLEPDPCWYDGVLGADALSSCAILFEGSGARLVCQNLSAQGSGVMRAAFTTNEIR